MTDALTDDNPIVDEIRRVREEMLAQYGDDIHALIRDMDRLTGESARAGRVVVTRGPRPVRPPQQPTRKVG